MHTSKIKKIYVARAVTLLVSPGIVKWLGFKSFCGPFCEHRGALELDFGPPVRLVSYSTVFLLSLSRNSVSDFRAGHPEA